MNSHSQYGGFGVSTIWDQTPPGPLKSVCNYVVDGSVVEIINNFFHLENPFLFFSQFSSLALNFFDSQPYPATACSLLGFPGPPKIYDSGETIRKDGSVGTIGKGTVPTDGGDSNSTRGKDGNNKRVIDTLLS